MRTYTLKELTKKSKNELKDIYESELGIKLCCGDDSKFAWYSRVKDELEKNNLLV